MDPCNTCVPLNRISKGELASFNTSCTSPSFLPTIQCQVISSPPSGGVFLAAISYNVPARGAKTEATFVKQCCLIVLFSHPTKTRWHHKAQGGPMVHCKRIFTHLIFRAMSPRFTYYLLFMVYILNKETINS